MDFGAVLRAAAFCALAAGSFGTAAAQAPEPPVSRPAPPSLKVPPGLTEAERDAVLSSGPWRRLGEEEIREALRGKTLHYLLFGRPRGEEHHFEDGRVVWRMEDGLCLAGVWVARNETLCYFYGFGRTGCWTMIEGPQGYRHRPLEGEAADVVVRRVSEEPVTCAPVPTS